MKTVLVTGGAGYIGSHACKALAAAGYRPVAYDNLVNGNRHAVKWGPFEHGDILDRGLLDAVIDRHRPFAIMHFAAFAYVGESLADPMKYYRNNVAGSVSLIDVAVERGIGHFVFSSSCAVYGSPSTQPISEETPLRPINPYGMSKLVVERMLRDVAVAHGLRWAALRYFNAAGADPDGEIGEDHAPETRIIPLALAAAAGETGPFKVFGADYETPDGTCIRDYIHVSDLAAAHVAALRALEGGMPSQALNLGTGRGHSVLDVLRSVRTATGREVPTVHESRREGDPAILVADATRAAAALGWTPALASLDDIIRTAWAWHRVKRARQTGAS